MLYVLATLLDCYHIATKISSIWLTTRTSIFTVSVQGAQYDNIAVQCKYEKEIQNGRFIKPTWKSAETTYSRLSHSNIFDKMESKFRVFLCWLWDRDSLYWYQDVGINFPIKFQTFLCQFHILYVNEPGEIRNQKN